jgi:hypothetical protein
MGMAPRSGQMISIALSLRKRRIYLMGKHLLACILGVSGIAILDLLVSAGRESRNVGGLAAATVFAAACGWGFLGGWKACGRIATGRLPAMAVGLMCVLAAGYFAVVRSYIVLPTLDSGPWRDSGMHPRDVAFALVYAYRERNTEIRPRQMPLHGRLGEVRMICDALVGAAAYTGGALGFALWRGKDSDGNKRSSSPSSRTEKTEKETEKGS